MMPVDIAKLVEQTKNSRLQNQVTAQTAKVKAQGGKVKKGGPSIISRIFDVAQRPFYGVSEGIARASEHMGPNNPRKGKNPITDILEGMGKGVAGVEKTDIGEALLRAAEADPGSLTSKALRENKYNFRTGAGLVGSVVLDPATYAKTVRLAAGGKAAAEKVGMLAVAKHMDDPNIIKKIAEAGEAAKLAKVESAAKAGRELSTKTVVNAEKSAIKAAKKTAAKEAMETIGKPAMKEALTDAPGKVQFKFAGKTVGESEKLYKGISNIGKVTGATKAGKWANEAFRPAFNFPEGTNVVKRRVELAGIAETDATLKSLQAELKGLSPTERTLITHAAEAGRMVDPSVAKLVAESSHGKKLAAIDTSIKSVKEKLTSKTITRSEAKKQLSKLTQEQEAVQSAANKEFGKSSSLHGQRGDKVEDLGSGVDTFRRVMDEEFEKDFEAGLFRNKDNTLKTRAEAYKESYVPHYYDKGLDEAGAIAKKVKEIGPDKPGFTMQQKVKSVADAKAKGLAVEEDSFKILARRITAGNRARARASYAGEVGEKWGVSMANKEARTLAKEHGWRTVDSPYIPKDTILPGNIADSLDVLNKMYDDEDLYKQFLGVFDKAQNHLKFWQTAANPGHHSRNFMSDVYQNFAVGGVKNPYRYEQSLRVLTRPESFKMQVGNVWIKGPDLIRHWMQSGAKPGFTLGELTAAGETPLFKGIKAKIAAGSGHREDFTRMANYIEQMKKYGKDLKAGPNLEKDLTEIANKAAAETRRVNIDYGDMTAFERKVMKRVVPYYSWARKNIPLQIEALAMNPGRVATIPKGTAAIQRLMGTDVGYMEEDPLATVPKYLREMSGIRLRNEGGGKDARYLAPSLPFNDISKYLEGGQQGIIKSLLSDVTPAIRVPFEQATGKQIFSGAKVPGNTQYAAGQVPLLRQIHDITTGKQKLKSAKTFNYLTGAGVYDISPAQKAGELGRQKADLQKTIRSIRDKAKKKAMGG